MSEVSPFTAFLFVIVSGAIPALGCSKRNSFKKTDSNNSEVSSSYDQLIGKTPLVRLNVLSSIVGCNIFVKMESMNPGGTGKDRAVKYMLQAAQLHPNYRDGVDIVEGSSGSTGISLAFQCNAKGLKLHVVMPDDQAEEKKLLLKNLGTTVHTVPCCSISNTNHYVNTARKLAQSLNGIFIDQFENTANYKAHIESTGPEIWQQTNQEIDAFVMSAGTGGTIAGVSRFLKERQSDILVVLGDPVGSSLLQKVLYNVCYTKQQAERTIKKHRYDSIAEGIGLDRITANFKFAQIDSGVLVEDQEIMDMAQWLLRNEGLFVGSSSALNIVAAVRTAHAMMKFKQEEHNNVQKELASASSVTYIDHTDQNLYTAVKQLQHKRPYMSAAQTSSQQPEVAARLPTIVTVVCDQGQRHLSRLWNPVYVRNYNIQWPSPDVIPVCLQVFPLK